MRVLRSRRSPGAPNPVHFGWPHPKPHHVYPSPRPPPGKMQTTKLQQKLTAEKRQQRKPTANILSIRLSSRHKSPVQSYHNIRPRSPEPMRTKQNLTRETALGNGQRWLEERNIEEMQSRPPLAGADADEIRFNQRNGLMEWAARWLEDRSIEETQSHLHRTS